MRKKEIIERLWRLQDTVNHIEQRSAEKNKMLEEVIEQFKCAIREIQEKVDKK